MNRNHLLGTLSLLTLVFVALGCRGSTSTPQVEHSPLVSPLLSSPVETPEEIPPTETPMSTPSKCPNGCLEPSEGCVIKGVVTGMGDKYYYLPDMESYDDAPPLIVKYGGRWFCTEEEAIKNGFQKPPE